jgi:hypothetical protein
MRLILLILASFFTAWASAGVYKCTDASGKKIYQSTPCASGLTNSEINIKTGSSVDLDEEKKRYTLQQKEQEARLEQQKLEQQQLQLKAQLLKQEAMNESMKNQLLIKSNPDKFSAFAIPPYSSEKLPPLVKTYEARLPDIERLRGLAAQKALASGLCGRAESAELNEKSTRNALVVLVDCSSGKQLYFSEQELAR